VKLGAAGTVNRASAWCTCSRDGQERQRSRAPEPAAHGPPGRRRVVHARSAVRSSARQRPGGNPVTGGRCRRTAARSGRSPLEHLDRLGAAGRLSFGHEREGKVPVSSAITSLGVPPDLQNQIFKTRSSNLLSKT